MASLKSKIKNYKERFICAYKILTADKFVAVVFDEKPEQEKFKVEIWDSQNLNVFFLSAVILSAQKYITNTYLKVSKRNTDALIKQANSLVECAKKEELQTRN